MEKSARMNIFNHARLTKLYHNIFLYVLFGFTMPTFSHQRGQNHHIIRLLYMQTSDRSV